MIRNNIPIIQAPELLTLYNTGNLVIADVSNGKDARSRYEKKHLEGALFIDLNTMLADIKDDFSYGGRHPLPPIENFANTLTNLGIANNSHIVIYDDQHGANAAARFWWMLKSAGHDKVQVLDGGLPAAQQAGFPVSSASHIPKSTEPYKISSWMLPLADILTVEEFSKNKEQLVIDVRAADRYHGDTEPIDLVAGHIPGAINIPYTENLDADGFFLKPAALKAKYEKAFTGKAGENIIVHCGSGVTACHTLLAIAYAGLEIPKLYVGSWSEWSRNNKPVATKNNKA